MTTPQRFGTETARDATLRIWNGSKSGWISDKPTLEYLETMRRELRTWLVEVDTILGQSPSIGEPDTDLSKLDPEDFNTLDGYQNRALDTANYPGRGETLGFLYTALGLAGEAGEAADKAKKILRDAGGVITPERREALINELGDVLWYVATMADELETDLSTVAFRNIMKLRSRKARGKLGGDGDNR